MMSGSESLFQFTPKVENGGGDRARLCAQGLPQDVATMLEEHCLNVNVYWSLFGRNRPFPNSKNSPKPTVHRQM